MYELTNVTVKHGMREVLRVPFLRFRQEEFTVILGHNGSGKSSLVTSLMGLQRCEGQIALGGQPLNRFSARKLAQVIAYMPQEIRSAQGLTVRELVELGRFAWRGNLGRLSAEDHALVGDAIACVDLIGFADHMVDQMSGGERQRAWLAMLLAQQGQMLILDEPVSALDVHQQQSMLGLLRQINHQDGRGVVTILHDLNLAARFADRIIVLKSGKIAFDDVPEHLMDPSKIQDLFNIHASVIPHPETGQLTAVF